MKRAYIVIPGVVLALLLFVHSGWAAHGGPSRNRVVFYQDDGCYGGTYLELGVGNYSDLREYKNGLSGGDTWNDRISCIAIGSGVTKVIVYEHINYEGRSKEFSRGWGNSRGTSGLGGDWWNDRISSIKIIGPGYSEPSGTTPPRNKIVLYQDRGYGGADLELGVGNYSDLREYKSGLSGGNNWNDRVSSIAAGPGVTKVIVYEDINYEGRSREFSQTWGKPYERWDFSDGWWNDRISSIKVVGPGYSEPKGKEPPRDKAVFYQDDDSGGRTYLELGVGNYADLRDYRNGLSGGNTWNDRISRIAMGSGISRVIVYEHVNYEGRSKEFKQEWGKAYGGWGLGGDWWNDRISSIKILGPGYSEPEDTSLRNKAVFYQDGGCDGGTRLELGVGNHSDLRSYKTGLSGGNTWNDRISCIAIGSGVNSVTVYEDINYGGRSKEFRRSWGSSRGSWGLGNDWWDDRISSVKIR
jgi:hypothetical protein